MHSNWKDFLLGFKDILLHAGNDDVRQVKVVVHTSLAELLEDPNVSFFALDVCEPSCEDYSSSIVVDSGHMGPH